MGRLVSGVVVCVVLLLCSQSAQGALATFEYEQIFDPIISASFSVDFAALNAHRTVNSFETNFARLVDMSTELDDFDLSDNLFGSASAPDDPFINMGPLETGIFSVSIDSLFFPALAGGSIGLNALFTDTVDAMFAIDFISLTIETSVTIIESFFGWPVGSENNGFGIGLADGESLPAPLPGVFNPTGTGFDEEISSISIIPEPTTLFLLGFGGLALIKNRRTFVVGR